MAAKTGSAQVSSATESNAVFVCFAPYDDPEIAISLVVEHGGSGSVLASLAAEILYSKVREYVGDTRDKVVFDLYSGTGTIAQLLASVAKEVIGVEIVEEAVEAAKVNAALNGLTNCRFIAGDVLKALDDLTEKPDMIVLDPPRDGIHPKALPKILAYGVENIVYISCKPTSLALSLIHI